MTLKCTHVYTHTHTHRHTLKCTHVHTHTYTHTHRHTLKCTHVHTHIYTHTGTHSSVHMYTHTYTHTHRHTQRVQGRAFYSTYFQVIKDTVLFYHPVCLSYENIFKGKVKMYPFSKSAFSEVQLSVDFNPGVLQKWTEQPWHLLPAGLRGPHLGRATAFSPLRSRIICAPGIHVGRRAVKGTHIPSSRLFTSGFQSTGASASVPVPPVNIQDWFSLGWTGLISLQSEGPSTVFSSSIVHKHQFFSTQSSLWTSSHIGIWLLQNP